MTKEDWEDLMSKWEPFDKDDKNIPDIPPCDDEEFYNNVIVPKIIELGGIPKDNLIVEKTYIGGSRNTSKAKWIGTCFEYMRYKWGDTYTEEVPHFEDENYMDMFIPVREDA